MSVTVRFKPKLIRTLRNIITKRHFASTLTEIEPEYTSTPQYPEILDTSYDARKRRKTEAVYDELSKVKTIEEKQIKLNMPKYYGFKCYLFDDKTIPYNQLDLIQHITRTHLIVDEKLPEFFNGVDVEGFAKEIRSDIEEVILMEDHQKNDQFVSNVIKSINRTILNCLSKKKDFLNAVDVDLDPRIESFWFAGGMNPPENIKKYRLGQEFQKSKENEPTNRAIRYTATPLLQLRSKLPLKPINLKPFENYEIPYFKYDPRVVGVPTKHFHATNIPGFWPGDKSKFILLNFQDSSNLSLRNFGDVEESKEAIHRQGILSSFGILNAQSNYLGFNTFNDITYNLVVQTVLTDGKKFSFYSYQLETLLVHSDHIKNNLKRNICYATPELNLYQEIDKSTGKLIGFNEDVLTNLIKYYLNEPEERLGVNLTPYLGKKERNCADYEDVDKRKWLEREYKFLMANRPRYKLEYEVYHWEKIYKIDNNTRLLEPRRRPFELLRKPSDRRLDDRQAFYVPKALRPNEKKNKGRYAKEYFP